MGIAGAIGTSGRKLVESLASRRLLAMLRNTQQKYPTMKVQTRRGGCGVFTAEGTFLYISYSGNLTPEAKRDLLGLFAMWFAVDPEGLEPRHTTLDGSSWTASKL